MQTLILALMLSGGYDYPPTGIYVKKTYNYPPTGAFAKAPNADGVNRGYPVRTGTPYYVNVNGARHRPDASHLKQGEHAGWFDSAWLDTLSSEDLFYLHGDAHLNKVDWSYAKRPKLEDAELKAPSIKLKTKKLVTRWACVNGRCGYYQFWE